MACKLLLCLRGMCMCFYRQATRSLGLSQLTCDPWEVTVVLRDAFVRG